MTERPDCPRCGAKGEGIQPVCNQCGLDSGTPLGPIADATPATCEARLWPGLCGAPATHQGTGLCVHEHVRSGALCGVHAQQALDGYDPDCMECSLGEGAHSCGLAAWTVEPLTQRAASSDE